MIFQINYVIRTTQAQIGYMSFRAKTASISSGFDSIFASCCDCQSQDKITDGQLITGKMIPQK